MSVNSKAVKASFNAVKTRIELQRIRRRIPEAIFREALRRPETGMALWLEPSFRMAQQLGMSDKEFGHWVATGLWNLSGSREHQKTIHRYRDLVPDFPEQAWVFPSAQVNPETAERWIAESGQEAALEAARVQAVLLGVPGEEGDGHLDVDGD